MKALALVLLLSTVALAGPAHAFKITHGTGSTSDTVRKTNLPDTVLGTSSQSKAPGFGFGNGNGDCSLITPNHHHGPHHPMPPGAQVTAPCAD